jgi:hypothetical protein
MRKTLVAEVKPILIAICTLLLGWVGIKYLTSRETDKLPRGSSPDLTPLHVPDVDGGDSTPLGISQFQFVRTGVGVFAKIDFLNHPDKKVGKTEPFYGSRDKMNKMVWMIVEQMMNESNDQFVAWRRPGVELVVARVDGVETDSIRNDDDRPTRHSLVIAENEHGEKQLIDHASFTPGTYISRTATYMTSSGIEVWRNVDTGRVASVGGVTIAGQGSLRAYGDTKKLVTERAPALEKLPAPAVQNGIEYGSEISSGEKGADDEPDLDPPDQTMMNIRLPSDLEARLTLNFMHWALNFSDSEKAEKNTRQAREFLEALESGELRAELNVEFYRLRKDPEALERVMRSKPHPGANLDDPYEVARGTPSESSPWIIVEADGSRDYTVRHSKSGEERKYINTGRRWPFMIGTPDWR